jgi:multidrug efflux system membrane fusion protein
MNINVSRRQTIGVLAVAALLAGMIAVGLSNPSPAGDPPAPKAEEFSQYVTREGGISLPADYREKFMHLGTYAVAAGLAFPSAGTRADDPVKGWTFKGRTQATEEVVMARVTGQVTRIPVRVGDAVKEGDLLAEIDPRAYRLDLDAARARQKVAEAKLQLAKLDFANTKKLTELKVVSREELAEYTAKLAHAEAVFQGAKIDVEKAELTLSWTRVTATFSGRVRLIQATEGTLVTGDKTPIARVVASGPLHVTFNVPEAILLQLSRDGLAEPGKLGVAVGFALDEGYPHPAKLDLIGPEADPKMGTVEFRATVSNPKGYLLSGLSARVRLTPPSKEGK